MKPQGQKIKNPFSENTSVKEALTNMFSKSLSDQLTTKDVYRYTRTEEMEMEFNKLAGVKFSEYRKVNSDGTMTVTRHEVKY